MLSLTSRAFNKPCDQKLYPTSKYRSHKGLFFGYIICLSFLNIKGDIIVLVRPWRILSPPPYSIQSQRRISMDDYSLQSSPNVCIRNEIMFTSKIHKR